MSSENVKKQINTNTKNQGDQSSVPDITAAEQEGEKKKNANKTIK